MKISILNKKDFLESLSKVHSVVEKRNTLQILTNVYLQVSNNLLTIKATDLEISMETTVPVSMEAGGNITVSAKNFFEIIKELPDKEVHISTKENHWISIICGTSKFNIMGIAPEDYPSLPSFSDKKFIPIQVDALKAMIDNTVFAISTDETRYHLNGVFFEQSKDTHYRMVATDGHRLAYCEKDLLKENSEILPKGVIIPRKGVQELRRLLDFNNSDVAVTLEGNHLVFKTDQTYLYIRLIEGRFPDYKQVIPKNNLNQLSLQTKDLILSLKRVSLLASEKSRGIKLAARDGKLEISTNNPDIGEAKEILETPYFGEPIEIGFNAKYLMDSITGVNCSDICIALNDRMSPGIVKIQGDESYLCVLMPMRL